MGTSSLLVPSVIQEMFRFYEKKTKLNVIKVFHTLIGNRSAGVKLRLYLAHSVPYLFVGQR